jgi:opacity protein-like surface antigen
MHAITAAAIAAIIAVSSYAAVAADLRGGGSLKDGPEIDPTPTYKYYIGVRGGWSFPDDTTFNTFGRTVKTDYDAGYLVSGVFGMELARSSTGRLRGDLEVGVTSASVNSHTITGLRRFTGASALGHTDKTFGLASLYYDFETGSVFKPFVGAGGGIADVGLHHQGIAAAGAPVIVQCSSDTAYAYHLTAGTNIQLSSSLDLEVAYRFLGTTGAELKARDGTRTSVDSSDNQLMFGLRQKF